MNDASETDRREPPTPADSPLRMQDVMASPVYRDLMTAKLEVGDAAFDFALPELAGDRALVRLSSFARRQPVALAFGSYT